MMNWLDKYLVPDWRDSWRMHSVQALAAFGAAISLFPGLFLDIIIFLIDTPWMQITAIGGVVAVIVLRLWNQEEVDDE